MANGGIWGDGQRGGIFGARVDPRLLRDPKIPVITLTAAERDRYMQQRAEAERQQAQARIAGAFDASQGMPEPSRALYEAKHQRAMDALGNRPPEEPGFWDAASAVASLGPRAVGGAQKMWEMAPGAVSAAAGALYNDPLGSMNRVGMAGQAATDAIVQGMARPFTQFGDPNVDPVENAFDMASVMGAGGVVAAERGAVGAAGGRLRPPTHLPMDEASRMARAKEMGFETDAYKGAYPYDYRTGPSRNWKGEEIENIGAKPELLTEFNSPNSPYAGFFSDDKEVANRFATVLGEGSVFPVKLKFKNPLIIDGKGKFAAAFQFPSIAREHGTLKEMEAFKAAFETGDYDGVIIKNTRDEGTIYVPKNPNQVRSKFANFDPAQSESGDILASGGKGGAKVGLAVQGAKVGRDLKQFSPYSKLGQMLDRAAQETAVQLAYERSAGEVAARNIQRRADMTPEERRATPPWKTQDVPDEQQIVRFRK